MEEDEIVEREDACALAEGIAIRVLGSYLDLPGRCWVSKACYNYKISTPNLKCVNCPEKKPFKWICGVSVRIDRRTGHMEAWYLTEDTFYMHQKEARKNSMAVSAKFIADFLQAEQEEKEYFAEMDLCPEDLY